MQTRFGLFLFLGLATPAAGLLAAAGPAATLSVTIQAGVPRVQASDLLADGKFLALLRSGFPLRLHYRLELWRSHSTWFDEHVSETAWDLVAHYDPLADEFVLVRTGGVSRRYAKGDDLAQALAIPFKVSLPARGSGTFYYLVRLEVSTLNDTDLQEIEHWLKGDVSPAAAGKGDLGDAVVRGAQRVLVRIAGLPRLTLEARSGTLQGS